MDEGAREGLGQAPGPGVSGTSGQEQATTRWVGTVVHLDTRRDPLTAGFLLHGVTGGREVEWLVDTGATTSLLLTKEWERVYGGHDLIPARMRITCVDGRPMEVRGRTELEIDFGGCKQRAHMVLADIGHGGILGMDPHRNWGASVDVGRGKVYLDTPGGSSEKQERWFSRSQS